MLLFKETLYGREIGLNTKTNLYKSLVRPVLPVLLYVCETWDAAYIADLDQRRQHIKIIIPVTFKFSLKHNCKSSPLEGVQNFK